MNLIWLKELQFIPDDVWPGLLNVCPKDWPFWNATTCQTWQQPPLACLKVGYPKIWFNNIKHNFPYWHCYFGHRFPDMPMSYNIYYNNNWLPLVFRLSESSIRICACIQGANMFQPSSLVACLCLTFIAGHGCRAFQLRHGLSSSGIAAQFAARCPKMKHCILEPQSWHGDPFHPQTWTERFSLEWSEWFESVYVCFGWELWRTPAAMEHEAQLARLNGWNHPCFESLEGADVVWKTVFPLNFVTQDALIVPLALGQSGPHWLCLSVYPFLPDLYKSSDLQPYMHRVGDSLIDKGTLAPVEVQRRHRIITQTHALHSI